MARKNESPPKSNLSPATGKIWLAIRSIAMTVLFPGTVVGYIPYRIVSPLSLAAPNEWSWTQYLGMVVITSGLAILLVCIWGFAHYGRGTLAPFDEPRKLVVKGLYKYVRNPMYVGVALILMGESCFFWSRGLLLYAILYISGTTVFVMIFEEPRLRSKYGIEYEQYCKAVGRWLPGKPYQGMK